MRKTVINFTPITISALISSLKQFDRLEVELLLAHILKVPRTYIHARPERMLNVVELAEFHALLKRRSAGEPLAYLLGYKEFWSLNFKVTKDVLIPRPETETLVQTVLEIFSLENNEMNGNNNAVKKNTETKEINILELGTGSGAIILALAVMHPHWKMVAVDKSAAALNIAKENAENLKVNSVQFLQSDWFSTFGRERPTPQFQAIIANPPYLSPNDPHLIYDEGIASSSHSALSFEPREALVSEPDGLEAFRFIIPQALDFLAPKAWLFLEHGYEQGKAVADLMRIHGYIDIDTRRDLAGLDRVTIGRK